MNDIGTIEENNAFVLGFASKGVLVVGSESANLSNEAIIEIEYEITEDFPKTSNPFGKSGYFLLWDDSNKYNIRCDSMTIDWGDGSEENSFSDVFISKNTSSVPFTDKIFHIYENIGLYKIKIKKIKGISTFKLQNIDYLKSFTADFSKCEVDCFTSDNNFSLSGNNYLKKADIKYTSTFTCYGLCYNCGSMVDEGMEFRLDAPNIETLNSCIQSCKIKDVVINTPKAVCNGLISANNNGNIKPKIELTLKGTYSFSSLLNGDFLSYLKVIAKENMNFYIGSVWAKILGFEARMPLQVQLESNFSPSSYCNESIEYIKLYDTEKITDITNAFRGAKIYDAELFIEDFSSVENADYAFIGSSIKSLPFDYFPNLSSGYAMFNQCENLTLSSENCLRFPKLKNAARMFAQCNSLNGNYTFRIGEVGIRTIDMSSFLSNTNFNSVKLCLPGYNNLEFAFYGGYTRIHSSEIILDFERTGNFSSISQAFENRYVDNLYFLNVDSFDNFNLTNTYASMYITNLNITGLKFSKIKDFIIDSLHNGNTIENISIDELPDTCENIAGCFYGLKNLKTFLSDNDTINLKNVKTMRSSFYNCGIESLHFSGGNKIEDISGAFQSCSELKEICGLNIEKVKNNSSMFYTFLECNKLAHLTFSGETITDNLTLDLSYCALQHNAIVEMFKSLPDATAYGGNIILTPNKYKTEGDPNNIDELTKADISIATNKGWNVDVDFDDEIPTLAGLYNKDWNLIYTWEDGINNGSILTKYNGQWFVGLNDNIDDDVRIILSNNCIYIMPDSYYIKGLRKIKSLIIPESIIHISGSFFQYCPLIESVQLPDNFALSDSNFNVHFLFKDCTLLRDVNIPKSTQTIPRGIFYGCTSLTNVKIPNDCSFTKIGFNSFYNCLSLNNFTIPNSVTDIGEKAFYNCSSLELKIPNSVTSIDEYSFYKVSHITYNGTATGAPWGALSMN